MNKWRRAWLVNIVDHLIRWEFREALEVWKGGVELQKDLQSFDESNVPDIPPFGLE